jgi:hypothetical protein
MTNSIQIWKIFIFLFAIVLFMFITSSIICGSNVECRYHIPTVSNMLNSTISTPFLISGFNVAIGFHLLTSASLYCTTIAYAYYWSVLQFAFAVVVYSTCFITLFIIPFTGWENNWANLSILVSLIIWMILAHLSIKRTFPRTANGWSAIPFYTFCSCVLIYIIVRAVPNLPENGRDIGMMVMEIVGSISFIAFMGMCVWYIRGLSLTLRPEVPENGVNEELKNGGVYVIGEEEE